ncbi:MULTISPECIES: sterol desaturase family protein [Pedobacter]|uniref:Fatty acid hydroxylase n=1 Tax=Pedobacter heparinus (strain ATCC 13125 / DSM 2366 / CIP 104194 / JCM 7457 / NBRC 12017 / NCIMB 9290 / NRRL B-14731 / HIM 762-3) TaxID=485917 RepID=C6XUP9_PEDHD|nr:MULTISPECIES: sterol desaturase family protein [Pedobacter]ACU03899.1 fatty acid hydroxylase [Pedobacter heparinus DSM 2366]MBB5436576.1 sterol desaturase/sphingolipid hydroxylase (fatty acid hydroxylase superfamily) [Pedobacter sp. AK017]
MKKNFVSNSRESIRMFKNPLFEALSKVPYYVPLIVYVPVIGYFFWTSVSANGLLMFLLHLVMGLFVWTLTEYVLHRFVFHFYPSSNWGKRIHFIFHGVHHDYPNDAQRLVMPPSASIPLATAFYFLFRWLLPLHMLDGFFAGFILGYLFYDITHYMLHHAQFKNGVWKKIKHHHMLHHYDDSTRGYGVTSALWDRIFGSDFLKK